MVIHAGIVDVVRDRGHHAAGWMGGMHVVVVYGDVVLLSYDGNKILK